MKLIKRFMSLALSLCMIMALCFTSFAAKSADKDTTLTIKTTNGHTYKVYQILKGDVSGLENGEGTLANVEVGSSVTTEGATADSIIAALKDLKKGELGNAAYGYVENGTAVETVVGDGKEKTVTVTEGYYVVTDEYTSTGTDSISRYLVAVAGPTTMEPKTQTTDIDKKIIDTDANVAIDDSKKTDTASIGDTIDFEVTGTVPNYEGYTYYYYVLNDTLSKGLTLVDAKETGFTVTVGGKTLTRGTDYFVYVTENEDGTTSFELAFEDIVKNKYVTGDAISIKYSATVNENAATGTAANSNTATLTYSNDPSNSDRHDKPETPDEPGKPGVPESKEKHPTGETEKRETKTYVTELKLTKVDQDGEKLTGAEFTLYGDNLKEIKFTTGTSYVVDKDGTYWKLKDGTYTNQAPIMEDITEGDVTTKANKDDYDSTETKYSVKTVVEQTSAILNNESTKAVAAFVNDEGYITFTGLHVGKYTLSETKTPAGYNTADDITFEISAKQDGSTALIGGDIEWSVDNKDISEANGTFSVTVKNTKGTVLPSTGGIGTTIFYVIGSVMVLGAAVLLITKKRMSSEN